jgi:hypothetical protein
MRVLISAKLHILLRHNLNGAPLRGVVLWLFQESQQAESE